MTYYVWVFLLFLVSHVQAQQTAGVLVADVGSTANADVNYWNSKCQNIPSTAMYVTVHMGTVIDYFKPVEGASFCDMLKTFNKHVWSPDGEDWVKPVYYGGHLGGSQSGWPKGRDGRDYLSFWGHGGGAHGGCCHGSKNDGTHTVDGSGWKRSFKMYYHLDNTVVESLLADVSSTATANVNYWNSKCQNIPSTALYVTVQMGTVIDYFKPVEGVSFCDMLKSKTKHVWSDDGENWVQPAYNSAHLGGSVANWPKERDGRAYLSVWGSTGGDQGGCCHASKNDGTHTVDTAAWKRSFKMYVHWVEYHDKYAIALKSMGRKCDAIEQYQGDSSSDVTPKSCRDYCAQETESYFSLWDDRGDLQCSCFHHCETEQVLDGAVTYEILSGTVLNILGEKDLQIEEGKNNIEIEKVATQTVQTKLETCNTDKAEVVQEKTLWKDRFNKAVLLEKNHVDFTAQALKAHPEVEVEAMVGASENNLECNPASTNLMEKVGFFVLGAVVLGVGFQLVKEKSEEKVPLLLEI